MQQMPNLKKLTIANLKQVFSKLYGDVPKGKFASDKDWLITKIEAKVKESFVGPAGKQGVRGKQGVAGKSVKGATGKTGPAGKSVRGATGKTGVTGKTGRAGADGPAGPAGSGDNYLQNAVTINFVGGGNINPFEEDSDTKSFDDDSEGDGDCALPTVIVMAVTVTVTVKG